MKKKISKKLLTIVITAILVGGLLTVVEVGKAKAQTNNENTTVLISPSAQEVAYGEEFTIEIEVNPTTSIAGAQFDLSFDPDLLKATSVEEGNLLSQGGADIYFQVMGEIDNENGKITGVAGVITTPGENVSSQGTFAIIHMTAENTEGTASLNLSNIKVANPEGSEVPSVTQNGSIEISPSGGEEEGIGISTPPIGGIVGGIVIISAAIVILKAK